MKVKLGRPSLHAAQAAFCSAAELPQIANSVHFCDQSSESWGMVWCSLPRPYGPKEAAWLTVTHTHTHTHTHTRAHTHVSFWRSDPSCALSLIPLIPTSVNPSGNMGASFPMAPTGTNHPCVSYYPWNCAIGIGLFAWLVSRELTGALYPPGCQPRPTGACNGTPFRN